jgi:hypothetical protein
MSGSQGRDQRQGQGDELVLRQALLVIQITLEIFPVQQLHHQIRQPGGDAEVRDIHDVRVLDRRGGLRLLQETLPRFRVTEQ